MAQNPKYGFYEDKKKLGQSPINSISDFKKWKKYWWNEIFPQIRHVEEQKSWSKAWE